MSIGLHLVGRIICFLALNPLTVGSPACRDSSVLFLVIKERTAKKDVVPRGLDSEPHFWLYKSIDSRIFPGCTFFLSTVSVEND